MPAAPTERKLVEEQNKAYHQNEHTLRFIMMCLFFLLCFSQKLDLRASASVAKSLFHWLRGRFMMLKRMLRIQFL